LNSKIQIFKLNKAQISDWLAFSENPEKETIRLNEYFNNGEKDLFLLAKGSTDISNKSMLRVFEQNNCKIELTQYFYKPE
jgi:hypothetical protein